MLTLLVCSIMKYQQVTRNNILGVDAMALIQAAGTLKIGVYGFFRRLFNDIPVANRVGNNYFTVFFNHLFAMKTGHPQQPKMFDGVPPPYPAIPIPVGMFGPGMDWNHLLHAVLQGGGARKRRQTKHRRLFSKKQQTRRSLSNKKLKRK
jgi:hypothetical protein